MTAVMAPISFRPPRHFENAAQWLHALGGIPLERIIFDPWPGTATEADLLPFVDGDKPGNATRVLDDAALLDGEDVLPGFSMAVADLFRDLPA